MFILNKSSIQILTITLFLSSASAAEKIKENAEKFKITDLFKYNEPVKKGDNEKKWFLNLTGGYTEKNGNTKSTNTTYIQATLSL
jgi:septal ring-binding cell division protein DamX